LPEPVVETLATADGWLLPAQVYLPASAVPPGIICLHRLGANRETWAQFARRAQALGYAVIVPDLRGHGGSRRDEGPTPSFREIDARGWKSAIADVRAAKQALIEAGASPGDLAIAGEGLGASIAMHHATLDDSIQALVLVSPQLEAGGIDSEASMVRLAERPVLLVAGEDDAAAYTATTVLDQRAGGFCELRVYPGAEEGANLFAVNRNALELTMQWLKTVIGPANPAE
jgi:pimeloyl-ACP methyl ester carboxylesterase